MAVPRIIGAVGFKSAGITAGSIAGDMMSAAAAANEGVVVASSAVAVLQSIGVAGFGTARAIAIASGGAAMGVGMAVVVAMFDRIEGL